MDTNKTMHRAYGGSKIFKIIWNLLLRVQEVLMVLSSILIILGISLIVLFRYIFHLDLFGMEEVILICAFWLYFIGGSYGTFDRSHISADFVSAYIKNIRTRLFIKAVTSLITLLICLLYTYWSVDFFQWTYSSGSKTSALHIPIIFSQSAITVGFFMMSFYLAIYFVRDTKELFSIPK